MVINNAAWYVLALRCLAYKNCTGVNQPCAI